MGMSCRSPASEDPQLFEERNFEPSHLLGLFVPSHTSDLTCPEHGPFARYGPCSCGRGQAAAPTWRIYIDILRLCHRLHHTNIWCRALAAPPESSTAFTEHLIRKDCLQLVDTTEEKSSWRSSPRRRCSIRTSGLGNRSHQSQCWIVGLGHRLESLHDFR
jgi:hypothetical protein